MINEIRVEIGGVGLLLRYKHCQPQEDKKRKLYIRDFIRPGESDFIIDIEGIDSPPPYPKQSELFTSKENWRSYIYNGSYILETYNNHQVLETVNIIKRSLNKAKVYILPQAGRVRNNLSLEYFMQILGQLIFVSILHKFKGLIIHSTGIVINKEGVVFCGVSGAGKTTLAKLLSKRDKVTVLSDDRIVVRRQKKGYFIYGTPWPGEGRMASFKNAPLKRIFFLSKAKQNKIIPLDEKSSFYQFLTQCFPALWDRESIKFCLEFCHALVNDIACFQFDFVPDKSAVEFIENKIIND